MQRAGHLPVGADLAGQRQALLEQRDGAGIVALFVHDVGEVVQRPGGPGDPPPLEQGERLFLVGGALRQVALEPVRLPTPLSALARTAGGAPAVGGQRPFQPGPPLAEVEPQLPEPPQRPGQPEPSSLSPWSRAQASAARRLSCSASSRAQPRAWSGPISSGSAASASARK